MHESIGVTCQSILILLGMRARVAFVELIFMLIAIQSLAPLLLDYCYSGVVVLLTLLLIVLQDLHN